MPTYNVLVAVVELIDADSPEAAVAELRRRLTVAGFNPHDDDLDLPQPAAFLSDVDTEGNPQ